MFFFYYRVFSFVYCITDNFILSSLLSSLSNATLVRRILLSISVYHLFILSNVGTV